MASWVTVYEQRAGRRVRHAHDADTNRDAHALPAGAERIVDPNLAWTEWTGDERCQECEATVPTGAVENPTTPDV